MLQLIISVIIDLFILAVAIFILKWSANQLVSKFKFGDKYKISKKNAFWYLACLITIGIVFAEVVTRPNKFDINHNIKIHSSDFEGFLFSPGAKNKFQIKKMTLALFGALRKHPNKMKYIDLGIATRGTPRDKYSPELFEYIRVTLSDDPTLCEPKETLAKRFSHYGIDWRWFPYRTDGFVGVENGCFVIKEIAWRNISKYEYRPDYWPQERRYYYFPPLTHRKSYVFPLVSPVARSTRVVKNRTDGDVYVFSSVNGLFIGSINPFFTIWVGPSDEELIEEFVEHL